MIQEHADASFNWQNDSILKALTPFKKFAIKLPKYE
jgi:hypothetical protein